MTENEQEIQKVLEWQETALNHYRAITSHLEHECESRMLSMRGRKGQVILEGQLEPCHKLSNYKGFCRDNRINSDSPFLKRKNELQEWFIIRFEKKLKNHAMRIAETLPISNIGLTFEDVYSELTNERVAQALIQFNVKKEGKKVIYSAIRNNCNSYYEQLRDKVFIKKNTIFTSSSSDVSLTSIVSHKEGRSSQQDRSGDYFAKIPVKDLCKNPTEIIRDWCRDNDTKSSDFWAKPKAELYDIFIFETERPEIYKTVFSQEVSHYLSYKGLAEDRTIHTFRKADIGYNQEYESLKDSIFDGLYFSKDEKFLIDCIRKDKLETVKEFGLCIDTLKSSIAKKLSGKVLKSGTDSYIRIGR